MASLWPKELNKQIGCSVRHRRVVGKLLGRRHQHRQLDEFVKPIQGAQMMLSGRQCVERSDPGGFLTVLDRKVPAHT